MSFLKDILVELQNCVHDEHSEVGVDLPVAWSRDFANKLKQNNDHWANANKQPAHMRTADKEQEEQEEFDIEDDFDEFGDDRLVDVGDDEDFENYDLDDDWGAMFGGPRGRSRDIHDSTFDEFEEENDDWDMQGHEDRLSARSDRDMSDSHPFGDDEPDYEDFPEDDELEARDSDFGYQHGYEDRLSARSDRDMSDSEPFGEYEEARAQAPMTKWTQKFLAQQAEEEGECPDCFGTKQQFPDLKDDCPSCSKKQSIGSFKNFLSTQEEQEEDDVEDEDGQENPDESDPTNKAVDDQYGLDDPNDDTAEFDDEADVGSSEPQEWDDPNYQGVLRTAPNAHLVYKRQQEDGTFNELWQYNLGDDFKKELEIRRAILAGTDIPLNKMRSPDNTQTYELWTVGNGQLLSIKGLPN